MSLSKSAVSVLMPVYNGERFLAEAIESILGQTFTDFEFVIVDDGSTDASPAILADYASRDPRIRVITQANAGIVAALNRGLAECRAPLVARMDADDISLPARLERQVDFLKSHPEILVVGCAAQLISEEKIPGPVMRHPSSPKEIDAGLQTETMLAHPSVLMRREPILKIGGYRELLRHSEDYDLWTRLAGNCQIANLPECLLHYRIHGGQISWEKSAAQASALLATRALFEQRRIKGHETVPVDHELDSATLEKLGISKSELEDRVVSLLVARIILYEGVQMFEAARSARQSLEKSVNDQPNQSLKRSVKARLAWLDFCHSYRRSEWGKAFKSLAQCSWAVLADARLRKIAFRSLLSTSPNSSAN